MRSTKINRLAAVVVFVAIFLATRLPYLGRDTINPDAVNWHSRSEQFIVGLKSGDLLKTYQHYHPGVTLMWIMGVPIEVDRQIYPQDRVYSQDNFIKLHTLAKYSLVLAQLSLSLALIYALKHILGLKKTLLAVSIFSFEPFFLGNSRLLHMDVLLTLTVVLSLAYTYSYMLGRSIKYLVFAGIFAGLAFLTKSVGGLLLIFIPLALVAKTKKLTSHTGVFLLATVATIFVLFPALWVNPKFVLTDIYQEGLRIGTRRGHEQIVLGDQIDIAGPGFYPLVLALKTSPAIWIGLALTIVMLLSNRLKLHRIDKLFIIYLTVFYLLYFVGMSLASKKLDRYMVPVYPWLGIVISITALETARRIKAGFYRNAFYAACAVVILAGVIHPTVKFYPYYFTYTNPFFGSAERANKIVGQKPFGIGIPELKDALIQKYGEVPLGFIDRKPMSTLYPNSKLFDIRETGTKKYNLVVLGPNEELADNIKDASVKFEKDYSMYINGLEFWRVYRKAL